MIFRNVENLDEQCNFGISIYGHKNSRSVKAETKYHWICMYLHIHILWLKKYYFGLHDEGCCLQHASTLKISLVH